MSKRLYRFGWTRDDIIKLYRFIDWVMRLPAAMEDKYHKNLLAYEKEVRMQYVSTAERIGIEKGMERGMERGMLLGSIQTALEIKFGTEGLTVFSRIQRIRKTDRLEKILEATKKAAAPNEVLEVLKARK